jgi:hypothetical protein
MSVLLSTAYFPPVYYFSKIIQSKEIIIETQENFNKQTYRNRCIILGANGPLNLTVPIQHGEELKTPIKDLSISYHSNWQLIHKRAIESSYRNSPFYEYYIDDFARFFKEKPANLIEFNTQILNTCLEAIGYKAVIKYTEDYKEEAENDYRYSISPKRPLESVHFPDYHQVFSDRFSFVPNLSILDLLFNNGPETLDILLKIP